MARIRTIKPEFWGDPKTGQCSRDARLLFLGLLNESDDEGRQLGSPRRIAGVVFPNDHDVTTRMVRKWLDELENAQLVVRYEVKTVPYLFIKGFMNNQKINRPSASRLPPPPNGHGSFSEGSVRGHGGGGESVAADLGSGSRNMDLGSIPKHPRAKEQVRSIRDALRNGTAVPDEGATA